MWAQRRRRSNLARPELSRKNEPAARGSTSSPRALCMPSAPTRLRLAARGEPFDSPLVVSLSNRERLAQGELVEPRAARSGCTCRTTSGSLRMYLAAIRRYLKLALTTYDSGDSVCVSARAVFGAVRVLKYGSSRPSSAPSQISDSRYVFSNFVNTSAG